MGRLLSSVEYRRRQLDRYGTWKTLREEYHCPKSSGGHGFEWKDILHYWWEYWKRYGSVCFGPLGFPRNGSSSPQCCQANQAFHCRIRNRESPRIEKRPRGHWLPKYGSGIGSSRRYFGRKGKSKNVLTALNSWNESRMQKFPQLRKKQMRQHCECTWVAG